MLGALRGPPAGVALAGAQRAQGHSHQRVGAQLGGGALIPGGARRGGHGVEGGVHQEGVGGGHEHAHLAHALPRRPRPAHVALGGIAATAPPGAVGVQGGQRPVEVARELGVRAVRGAGQDLGLDGAGRLRAHAGEPARDDGRLGLVDQTHAVQRLGGRQHARQHGLAAVQEPLCAGARDAQSAGDLTGDGEPVLLRRHEARGVVLRPPRGRSRAQFRGARQAGARQGLGPMRPGGQAPARGDDLAQRPSPQVRQGLGRHLAARTHLQAVRRLQQRPLTRIEHPLDERPLAVGAEQAEALSLVQIAGRRRVPRRSRTQERAQEPFDDVGELGARGHGGQAVQDLLVRVGALAEVLIENPVPPGHTGGPRRADSRGRCGRTQVLEHVYSLASFPARIQAHGAIARGFPGLRPGPQAPRPEVSRTPSEPRLRPTIPALPRIFRVPVLPGPAMRLRSRCIGLPWGA